MIFSYNKAHVGDTLIVITADDKGLSQFAERKANVAQIKNEEGTTVGWNFFHISEVLPIEGNGQIDLREAQVEQLNQLIFEAGFEAGLVLDKTPKLVTGFVKSCVSHPDSDHLSITETEVDGGQILQIVCGAANIRKGLKVVVAKPGAMMPDGLIIWPGTLRGVESFGMICSAKELGVANPTMKKGILELPQDTIVGEAFEIA